MTSLKYIEKAAQYALSEALGYDEARAYYLLLSKQESQLENEFSYSKRYRLLKSLFEIGAVGKIKSGEQEFFSYFLLPPTFLYGNDIDSEIMDFLEGVYLNNFSEIFEKEFSQIMLKDEKSILLFLLKHFMKEEARLVVGGMDLKSLGEERKKIKIVSNENESRRKIGVIDKNRAFEFTSIVGKYSNEYIGYITKNGKNNGKDYFFSVEKEIE